MKELAVVHKFSLKDIDVRKLICANLVLIMFMDSFVMWNDPLPGKLFTYGLKFINIGFLPFLLQKNKERRYIWSLLALPLTWIVWEEKSLLGSMQYFFSATLPVVSFLLLRNDEQAFVIKTYLRIILVLFIPGVIIYCLINVVSLPHLTYVRTLDKRSYENYFFLYYSLSGLHFRFFSIFDEPGVVGSLAAIVTLLYRKFLSKREYIIYIVAGFLSVSLFFIVVFPAIYYFSDIRFIPKRRRIKRVVVAALAIITFYFSFIFVINKLKDDPLIKFAVYNRFKWENGFIVGVENNRDAAIGGFESAFDALVRKGGMNFWFGNGKNMTAEEFGASGLSYKILIYEKGLAIIIYILLLIVMMLPWRRYSIFSIVSLVFLLLLLLQRPLFFKIDYFALVFTGVRLAPIHGREKDLKSD